MVSRTDRGPNAVEWAWKAGGAQREGAAAVEEAKNNTGQSVAKPENAPEMPPRRPLRRRVVRLVFLSLLIYACYLVILYRVQDSLVFVVQRASPVQAARPLPTGFERVMIAGEGGIQFESWFARGAGIDDDHPGPVVVFFHGNADMIDRLTDRASDYSRLGCSTLLVEYPGYRLNEGTPSEGLMVDEGVWAVALLLARHDVKPDAIVLHGMSLGTGVAAQVAARTAPAAVILDSPFTSVASFAAGYLVPPAIVKNPFHTDRVLGSLTCPILIIHGTHDTIVPISHGRSLVTLNPRATLVEIDAGHLDLADVPDAYWNPIRDLLVRVGVVPRAGE